MKRSFLAFLSAIIFSGVTAWSAAAQEINPDYLDGSLFKDFNGDEEILFVAFGDSITRGQGDFIAVGAEYDPVPIPSGEAGYPLRIETLAGVNVSNQGVPGEVLSRAGLFRFASVVPYSSADVVIIGGGANDANADVSGSGYFRSVQTMINIARASGAQVVLMTNPPICCYHVGQDAMTSYFSSKLRELSVYNSVRLADVEHGYDNTCNSAECYLVNLPEGLHPNVEGYDVVGEIVLAALFGIDLFSSDGASELEKALNLEEGTVITQPDPEPVE